MDTRKCYLFMTLSKCKHSSFIYAYLIIYMHIYAYFLFNFMPMTPSEFDTVAFKALNCCGDIDLMSINDHEA